MATQARAKELVILEVQVDVQGVVKSVRVLRGHPLFDEPAMDAVRQWRAAAAERRADRWSDVKTLTTQLAVGGPSGSSGDSLSSYAGYDLYSPWDALQHLSKRHRDDPGNGCVFAALGGEVARGSDAVRSTVTKGVRA